MSLSLALQYAVIALAVLVSAGVVLQKQFPSAMRRLRIACALPLLREGRADWLQALGRRLSPAPAAPGTCGGCSGCDPKR